MLYRELVACPQKEEQVAIAEALSDADALIESLSQLLAKKRHLKQGAMQELLTGKKRLPGFSGEWKVMTLYELFNFSGGFSASREQLSTEGYCYLHYGDIHTSDKSVIDVCREYQDLPKLNVPLKRVSVTSLLSDGDVVFVDASEDDDGTSKHVVICNPDKIPFISGLHTIVAKSKSDQLAHQYRRYCFQTSAIKAQFLFYAVGTKVSGISKSNIVKITLPVPSVPEQSAIATILSDMDAEIAELEIKLVKARQIKQGMMQELLTGRIRLVQPASNVVLFQAKAYPVVPKAAAHNEHINDAVVIGVLVNRFATEQYPLGRFRRMKLAYLLHRHHEGEAKGFLKKAAGPYNPTVKYGGAEAIALKNGYVKPHRSGNFEGFIASVNAAKAEAYFERWYGTATLQWLEQFRFTRKEELELLTTVDKAMVELSDSGKAINLHTVKAVIENDPEWKDKLSREIFSDDNIVRVIGECGILFGS